MPLPLLALAAPAIISGAASLFGGLMGNKAAKKAAKAQTQAAEKVAGISRGVYQDQMAGMEPYAAVGRSSVNTLGRLMQPGIAYRPEMQLRDAQAQYSARPPWSMTPGENLPPAGVSPTLYGRQQAAAQPQMVRLRSPNGSIRMIPANQAESYIQRGAVRA